MFQSSDWPRMWISVFTFLKICTVNSFQNAHLMYIYTGWTLPGNALATEAADIRGEAQPRSYRTSWSEMNPFLAFVLPPLCLRSARSGWWAWRSLLSLACKESSACHFSFACHLRFFCSSRMWAARPFVTGKKNRDGEVTRRTWTEVSNQKIAAALFSTQGAMQQWAFF